MPNTLHEKALKQPLQVGLMLGALALPTLWTVSLDILRLLFGKPLLQAEEVTTVFAMGCIPGMVLGAGLVRAWAAPNASKARRLLLGHSSVIAVPNLLIFLFSLHSFSKIGYGLETGPAKILPLNSVWNATFNLILDFFPLHCALAMLLFGLFMRGSRA